MSKLVKKVLVASASLLMLASVGSGIGSTTHASEASAFNRLTNLMGNDRHVKTFQYGADGGYTLRHNGKRITVTMTYASINGHKVSFSKALRAFEHKSSDHHYYRLVRRNHSHRTKKRTVRHHHHKTTKHHVRRHAHRHGRRSYRHY